VSMVFNVIIFLNFLAFPIFVFAGEADVIRVETQKIGAELYNFKVTVTHQDEGWDHFADRWEIVAPDGFVLGTRVLLHPHVGEQPFTRSLADVHIPESISTVIVRAHDSVHESGGREATVHLSQ